MGDVIDKVTVREIGEKTNFHAQFESAKTKDLGDGLIEAIISTNSVDHHGESINIDGVDVDQYHGSVLYGHDYEGLPIGKTVSLTKMKNKIKAKFQLAVKEYPFAQTVYDMIKGGYLTDVSIGGLVKKWSDDFKIIEEMTMKEFSVVPIGANPDAMITAIKALKIEPKQLEADYKDFASKILLDKVSSLDEDDIKKSISVLNKLVATLMVAAEAETTARADTPKIRRIKRITLMDTAKAAATQSQRVITTIKIKRG